jgi:hypothetical protein
MLLLLLLLLLARDTSPRFPWAKEKRRGDARAKNSARRFHARAYINILNRAAFAKSKHSNFAQARTKLDFYSSSTTIFFLQCL